MKPTERTIELRRALVATVDAAPFSKRRPRRIVIAAIATLVLAGAVTGGAVAVAATSGGGEPTPEQLEVSGIVLRNGIVGTHADLLGEPFLFSASGTTHVDLGVKPDGASALAFGFDCIDDGDYDILIDDTWMMGSGCEDDGLAKVGGGGAQLEVAGDGPHTLTIRGPGSYIVWAQWSHEHDIPPSSALQEAALADGVVTRDEYIAGFVRFVVCMEKAGYPIALPGIYTSTVLTYSLPSEAVDTGTDRQCYEPEFMKLDMAWQVANQDTSSSTQLLRDCLTAHGITPAYKTDEVVQQFTDNGIPIESCTP